MPERPPEPHCEARFCSRRYQSAHQARRDRQGPFRLKVIRAPSREGLGPKELPGDRGHGRECGPVYVRDRKSRRPPQQSRQTSESRGGL